jgi:hypothetical protein
LAIECRIPGYQTDSPHPRDTQVTGIEESNTEQAREPNSVPHDPRWRNNRASSKQRGKPVNCPLGLLPRNPLLAFGTEKGVRYFKGEMAGNDHPAIPADPIIEDTVRFIEIRLVAQEPPNGD